MQYFCKEQCKKSNNNYPATNGFVIELMQSIEILT